MAGITGRGVDERSDIYSLGATLYHLLTGINPSVDFGAIKPISELNIKIGEGFQMIIEKMMELDPDRRYQNGKELLYALEHVYELDSDYKRFRRNRRLYKGCAAALLIAGAAMMGTGWFMMGRERLTAYNRAVEAAGLSIEAGDFDRAEQEIHEALELHSDRIEVYEREVLRLYSMGDYEAAITYGRDVINNPLYEIQTGSDEVVLGDIYYLLGNAYFELTDYMNASACFQEAVSRNRENGLYFRDYAITLAKTGNTEQAEKELETAISLGLGQDSIYMAQGEISFARGEYPEAEESLQKAISYAESDSLRKRAVLLCDSVYQELGADYLDREIAMLEQEESRYGDSTSSNSLTERLADAYVRKAEADENQRDVYFHMALEKFVGLYESGYVTRQLMENIAIIYEQLDEFDQAESVLIQMTERYPDSYVPYKRLAYLEADRQQVKENADREYQTMKEYYDMAKELYGDQDGDQEMQMLDAMMQELRDGGWL